MISSTLGLLPLLAHSADQKACVPRIEMFKNIETMINYVGLCKKSELQGEDRLRECGTHMTHVVQSDGKNVFIFNLSQTINISYITAVSTDVSGGNEKHFVVDKLFISRKDQTTNPILASLKEKGSCLLRTTVPEGSEVSCTAIVSEQKVIFEFVANTKSEITNVCPIK